MADMKRLPSSMTVLIESTVSVVDTIRRSRQLSADTSVRVVPGMTVRNINTTVLPNSVFSVGNIEKFMFLSSYQQFLISYKVGTTEVVDQLCDGTFFFTGKIEDVVVKNAGTQDVRLECCCI